MIHIIDDDTTLLEGYKRALKKHGYEVMVSDNGQDGLAKVKKHHPDLVFVDVALDKEDGIELMKKIKSGESLQDIFVVLISGKEVSAGSVSGGLNAGADEYLTKPLTNKELLAHTDAFIQQQRTIAKLRDAERRFSKLIHQNADAIIVLSKTGTIRFANPAAGKFFSLDSKELRGMVFGLPATVDKPTEVTIPSKKYGELIAEMNAVEEEWEGEEVYIATLRDVTERKKAREQVEHLNSLLHAISNINQIIVQEKNIHSLMDKAAKALFDTRSYLGITIGLFDETHQVIKPQTVAGDHYFPKEWNFFTNGEGESTPCIQKTLSESKLLIISEKDFCRECRYSGKYREGHYKIVLVPMQVNSHNIGLIVVTLEERGTVDEKEQRLLQEAADDLSMAYEKITTQKELEKTEESYKELFEKSPVGIFQTTSEGDVKSVNNEMAHILGFESTEEAIHYYNDLKRQLYANPRRRDEFVRLLKKDEKVNNFEYEAFTANGRKIWIAMDAAIGKYYPDGSFLIDGFASDITEEKEAKTQLQASEKRYRELFESIRDAILVADTQRNIIDCNKAFADLFGYKLEEIKGQKTQYVYNDLNDYKRMGEAIRKSDPSKNFYYTVHYRKKNGEVFPGETNVFFLYDDKGNVTAVIGLIRDVSDRVEAYKKVEESEQRFRTVYESSAVGIKRLSPDLNILDANQAYCKFTGYTEEELKGKSIREITHRDDEEAYSEKMNQLYQGEIDDFEMEKRFIRKDGQAVWGISNVFAIRDEKGKPSYFLGNVIDIDKRKKAENELRQKIEDYEALNEEYLAQNEEYQAQNEELNQHLAEIKKMNEELEQAKKKAEESDRLKSSFLANMSHEIRTPMNAIVGFSDMLNDPELDDEERTNYVSIIQNKADMLLQLITDIVDVSKMESGHLDISPEQVEVNKLIAEVYSISRITLENAKKEDKINLKTYKDQPGEEVKMKIDSGRLSQIINNLVGNAIKYTNEGTIEIGYTTEKGQITFYVKDTGTGIPEKDQENIFKRFRRGSTLKDPLSNKLYRGTGLGLSIVSELTRLMNGRVTLDSGPGKGSVFYISFPWEQSTKEAKQKTILSDHAQTNFKNKRILLVEDDEDNMEYLKALFRNTGVTLLTAETGEKAIEISRNQELDLILMDIKLPGIDGYEATQKIRALNPKVPIIAQTAHAMSEDRQKALNAGCNDYISKPLKRAELFPIIRKVVQ